MEFASKLSVLAFVGSSAAACAGTTGTDAGNTPDVLVDTGTSVDVVTSTDSASDDASSNDADTTPVINACTSDVYMDMSTGTAGDRMIMLNGAHQFDMPCMTINAGQAVMFMWAFSSYPIAPGVAPSHASDPPGASPSPIQPHMSGSVYTVTFPTAGFYPFYVVGHDASGLMGVIQVQ